MTGVLNGIRVLDLGRYVAGPYCATLLGYLGANVIRVERPGGGEDRFIAPLGDDDAGSVMMQTGCNKRSLTLNLRNEQATTILQQLVGSCDVIVANLPPAFLQRIGLSYEQVKAINPRAILMTQSAFGSAGPWADRGGFDGIGQAMSGAMYMSGMPGQPAKAAAPYVDYSTAVLAAFGALAALMEREQSGQGQQVQGSLLGTALAAFNSHLIEQAGLDINRAPSGNRVQTSAPSDVFATRDGHVLTHVVGNGLFKRLANLIGADDWLEDPRLMSDQARGDLRDQLCERLTAWCQQRGTDEVVEAMAEAGVPAGPVLNLAEALAHPQVQASDVLRATSYPGRMKTAPVAGLPFTMMRGSVGIQDHPSTTGQHTDEVLAELGYDADTIKRFRKQGVV